MLQPSKDVALNAVEFESRSQGSIENLSIRGIAAERLYYENYPDFQRGKVWPLFFKRALIDTILRGLPIYPILTYIKEGEVGKQYVIDGHQRLSTVFDFMDGKFATATIPQSRKDEPNSLTPVEPGRRYMQLSPDARARFQSYKFNIHPLAGYTEKEIRLLFRRLQHQVPLKLAERLDSYQSHTRELAHRLEEHPVWTDFYLGPCNRKQVYHGCLSLIALEDSKEYVSVDSRCLNEYASGAKDERVTPELIEVIRDRLEAVKIAFAGTTFFQKDEIIPMYQAIIQLESSGHTITTSSSKGCLTEWFGQLQDKAKDSKRYGYINPFKGLTGANMQSEFWSKQLPSVVKCCK